MLYLDGHGGIFPKKNKFPKLKNTRIPHTSKNWDPPPPFLLIYAVLGQTRGVF